MYGHRTCLHGLLLQYDPDLWIKGAEAKYFNNIYAVQNTGTWYMVPEHFHKAFLHKMWLVRGSLWWSVIITSTPQNL